MSTPTQTTNKLHFEDLDSHRFEDMGYELLYRLQKWSRREQNDRSLSYLSYVIPREFYSPLFLKSSSK